MKITGKLNDTEFEIVKYNGINVKSDDNRVVEALENMTAEVFNPQTTSLYHARLTNSLLDAYLVLTEKKRDGLNIELKDVPDSLFDNPDDDEDDDKVY